MRHVVFLVFLSLSCSRFLAPEYPNMKAATAFKSVVKITTVCPDGAAHGGTGVAITTRYVITARHVVDCNQNEPVTIVAERDDGWKIRVALERYANNEADVALLIVNGTGKPFEYFSRPDLTPPKIGDEFCTITARPFNGVKKCGFVSASSSTMTIVALRGFPGNSGSPLFDSAGQVRGILFAGTLEPTMEPIILATPTSAWWNLMRYPEM